MSQPRFAQILSSRRKQLRLSIPQAAKVLRMRESVLEAFEDGDFDRLPALGYAQGMVASYARYLGLDSREIIELYEEEHERYVSEVTGKGTFGLPRLSDEPANRGPASAASAARPSRQYGAALPAARGVGGVNLPSDYGRTAGAGAAYGYAQAASAFGYAPSQAGAARGYEGGATRGSAEITPYAPQGRGDYRGYASDDSYRSGRSPQQGRRYTTINPEPDEQRARHRQAASARRYRGAEGERRGDYGFAERTGDITTRSVHSGQYRDDMRYDDGVDPYRPSSTRAGRASASRPAQPPERPNVRRRQAPSGERDPRSRGRRNEPQRSGIAGAFQRFAAEPSRVVLLIAVLLALVLALILVFSIRSCTSATNEPRQVSVVTAASTGAATSATTVSEAEQQAIADAAAKAAASSAAAATTETVVEVSVASGATTWVEITCDGEVKRAESITGAWSEQYTVTKTIEIQVADSSVVTVTKNGERVQLSSKTTGLASVTIQGTDPSAATTSASTEAATGGASSEDSSSSDGSTEDSSSYDESADGSSDYYDESYYDSSYYDSGSYDEQGY